MERKTLDSPFAPTTPLTERPLSKRSWEAMEANRIAPAILSTGGMIRRWGAVAVRQDSFCPAFNEKDSIRTI